MQQIVEQLRIVERVYNIINIRNFIKPLGKEVEDLAKDLIKHVTKLYIGPNRDIETYKDDFI